MKQAALIGAIALVAFTVYVPNISNEFINWDFPLYNSVFYADNSLNMTWRLITDTTGHIVPGYYAPLSSISLMLDKFLVSSTKPEANITKLLNVLLHILNGILVCVLVRIISGSTIISMFAMGIFLLHPIQVQSVLWSTQRKTLLCAFFTFFSYICYMKGRSNTRPLWYVGAIILFGLGLLSKPAYASFPLVLLFTEFIFFPTRSTKVGELRTKEVYQAQKKFVNWSTNLNIRSVMVMIQRTAPFFVLAIFVSIITIKTESQQGTALPLVERPLIAASAIWFYVYKALVPIHLIPIYPRWEIDPGNVFWWIPLVLIVVVVSLIGIYRNRFNNQLLLGLANFIVPLLPALGFFKFGSFRQSYVADHLLYFAMLGFAFALSFVVLTWATSCSRIVKHIIIACFSLYIVLLGMKTYAQTKVWADSISLWSYTVNHNPASFAANANLGAALLAKRRLDDSSIYLHKALEIDPDSALAYSNLGMIEKQKGNLDEAIRLYKIALKKAPELINARNNLGLALDKKGKLNEAIHQYQLAVQFGPYNLASRYNLADALLKANRIDEAVAQYLKTLELRENVAKVHNTLGVLYLWRGRMNLGIKHLQRAIELEPNLVEARQNLQQALQERNRPRILERTKPNTKDPGRFKH